MSDKIDGLIVTLDGDYSEEDLEYIKDLIICIKGVSSVKDHIRDAESIIERERVRHELQSDLYNVLRE